MKKIAIILTFLTTIGYTVNAQNSNKPKDIYEVNLAVDLPIALVGSAFTAYGFKKIQDKSGSTLEQVNALNYNDVSGFNRFFSSSPNYSERANYVSEYFFYGAFPIGIGAALIDKNLRSDFGTIALMYWETIAITGALYSNIAANVVKYRPLAYPGSGAPDDRRMSDGAKNAFPGGHPTITAAASFFTAKVLQDYYPHRKGLHIAAYSTASALTLANVYLRHQAGKHFASDLIAGLSYSVSLGILVPQIHKIAKNNERVAVYNSFNGMTVAYTIE